MNAAILIGMVALVVVPYAFFLTVVVIRLLRSATPPVPKEGAPTQRRSWWDIPVDKTDDDLEQYYSSREYPWT